MLKTIHVFNKTRTAACASASSLHPDFGLGHCSMGGSPVQQSSAAWGAVAQQPSAALGAVAQQPSAAWGAVAAAQCSMQYRAAVLNSSTAQLWALAPRLPGSEVAWHTTTPHMHSGSVNVRTRGGGGYGGSIGSRGCSGLHTATVAHLPMGAGCTVRHHCEPAAPLTALPAFHPQWNAYQATC